MNKVAKTREPKGRTITVRMEQSLADKIERSAEKNYRTISQEVRMRCLRGSRRLAK